MTNALDERARHASNALRDAAAQRIAQTAPAAVVSMETRRRRTPLLLLAAAIVAVVALVAGVVATNGTNDDAAPDIATTTPDRFEVAGRWSVAKHHGTLTSNGDIVWVGGAAIPACPPGAVECSRSSAQRVDTKTGTVTNLEPVPGAIQSVAYGFGSLWVAHGSEAAGFGMSRLDPETGRLIERWDYSVNRLAVTADAVWAIGDKLVRINPADNEATESDILPASYHGFAIVAAGNGVVVTATDREFNFAANERVLYIDRTGVQRLITSGHMLSLAVDGNDLWVATDSTMLVRFNLSDPDAKPHWFPTGDATSYPMLASGGHVWFLDLTRVGRFDPVLDQGSQPKPFVFAPIEGGRIPPNSEPNWIPAPGGFWVLSTTGVLMKLGAPAG